MIDEHSCSRYLNLQSELFDADEFEQNDIFAKNLKYIFYGVDSNLNVN